MSTHDITIDDGCPLISYSGDWNDSTNQEIVGDYWLNTYHSTEEVGASASFKFTGTAVYLYGSKRSSHGTYDVDIDGASLGQFDGSSTQVESMVLLASAERLTWGEHTVTITNSDPRGRFLDLDQIRWTTGKPGLSSITNSTEIDDADGSVSYTPAENWSDDDPTEQTGAYHQNTVHFTSTVGSAVSVRFNGNAVYVFGSTDSFSGAYDAQIDGNTAVALEGTTTTFRQPALLYYVDGLDSGDHTLTLTNRQQGSFLRFDYAVASTWAESTSSGNADPDTPSSAPVSVQAVQSASKTAVIIGSTVGGVVGLLLLILFALCFMRLRRAAIMDESRSDLKVVVDGPDSASKKPRPLSAWSWNPQRSWMGDRPVSAVSGASSPGIAGVGAHSGSGWTLKRRSAQQYGKVEKAYPSSTLMPPSR